MDKNIGKMIKNMAIGGMVGEIIASIIVGVIFIDEFGVFIGVFLLIGGPLFAVCASFFLYGFGVIVDKLTAIEANTRNGKKKSNAQTKTEADRMDKLEKLRSQGLITEEEYVRALTEM